MRLCILTFLFAVACGGDDEVTDTSTGTGTDTDAGDDDDDTDGPGDTTPVPTEPVDSASLAGKSYVVDLAGGYFVEPPGVGPLIQGMLTVDVLLGVVAADAATLELRGAITDESGAQDMCAPSIPFPAADFSENPSWSVGPETLDLNVAGVAVSIEDLELTGAFTADGSEIVAATLAGSIDTRPLIGLVEGTTDDAICELVAAFGVSCIPCPDGEPYCLDVYVTQLNATAGSGSVVEVTDEMIAGDPACAPATGA